ncbi:Bro-N domain-containing protein [Glycomyces sp. NPDC048151]|uniref:BRO-N domain-containing protein n=1 Tax=Glycomyces sp. NPDC048151 TaxID=3364002 RepID=UPI003710766A
MVVTHLEVVHPPIEAVDDFTFPATGTRFRVLGSDNDADGLWFVAADVAEALGYQRAPDLVRRLAFDEKGVRELHTPGGAQVVRVINEPGLYQAAMGAKTQLGVQFRRWIAHDLLPKLRRTGRYVVAEDLKWKRAAAGLEVEIMELETEVEVLGDRAVLAIGSEFRHGGVSVWEMRDCLVSDAELDGPTRSVMCQLEDLGVLYRIRHGRYVIMEGWHDLLFAETRVRRGDQVSVYSWGVARVRPGCQREFLTRVYLLKQEQKQRASRRRARSARLSIAS